MEIIKEGQYEKIISNPRNRALARKYDEYENVVNLDIDDDGDGYDINGEVQVKDFTYSCNVQINEEKEIIGYQCGCRWCDEHSACAHIGALMIKLESLDIDNIPFTYERYEQHPQSMQQKYERIQQIRQYEFKMKWEYQKGQFLLNTCKENYEKQLCSVTQNEKCSLIPELFVDWNGVNVEFYIQGSSRKYVLKSLPKFISMIDESEAYRYGKALELVHSEDAFDEEAQTQIAFIRKALWQINNDRQLWISATLMDEFFDIFQAIPITNATLHESDQKLEIVVKKEPEHYKIELLDKKPYVVGQRHFYLVEQKPQRVEITRYPFDEEGLCIGIMTNLLKQEQLYIQNDDFPAFEKYAIQILKDYVNVHSDVDLINNDKPEEICIYGDIENEEMIVYVRYYSDETKYREGFQSDGILNTFQQDAIERIILSYADRIDWATHIAYFKDTSKKTQEFIEEKIPYLQTICKIYLSDAFKQMGTPRHYAIHVGIGFSNQLLEVNIESDDIPIKELADVLKDYKKRKKFHRLKNGDLLYLESQELEELDQFMEQYQLSLTSSNNGTFAIQPYRSFALDQSMDENKHMKMFKEESYQKLMETLHHKKIQKHNISKSYDKILRDYQKEGIEWLLFLHDANFHGILADDMGLGKTLQVIALLDTLKEEEGAKPSIVICPASLIYNWEDEIHKFSTNLSCAVVCGDLANRKEKIAQFAGTDVLITSYDYLRRDNQHYENISFRYIILDESQNIKNQNTKNAQTAKELKGEYRLALSGTPIENSLAELWSVFDFLMPNYLYNYHYFKTHYESLIVKDKDMKKQAELKKLVSPFILRRTKGEVLKELPEKEEHTLLLEFSEEEKKLYYAHLMQVNKQLESMVKEEKVDKIAVLALLTKLRQLCCEPRILFENIQHPSSKLNACMELIETFVANDKKILLFSTFTSTFEFLAEELKKRNISYFLLTGQTSKEQRRVYVNSFQTDQTQVFMISLKAGGTGLNLTAAEAVIHFDPWWNISAQNQATDRAHRIGQNKNVQVFRLIMKNSVEEKIGLLQEKKKDLADAFIEDNTGSITTMSTEDILDLFKI